jgi:competence protein ComEC
MYINKGSLNYLEKDLSNAKVIDKNIFIIDSIAIKSLNNRVYSNENDNSLVLMLNIYNYNILLMGDASKKVEKDIIASYKLERADILKVGHHGSETSTSEELLGKIWVKYAIISAGKKNKYNHPSKDVIKLLKEYKIRILNTIDDDTIIFKIDKKILRIIN